MKTIVELNTLEDFEPIEGLTAKVVHTYTQTFAFWTIKKGAILPEHNHEHEQVSVVTKGILELTIEGKTTQLTTGMMAIIPAWAFHSAKAITKVEVTDVFNPIREDFK